MSNQDSGNDGSSRASAEVLEMALLKRSSKSLLQAGVLSQLPAVKPPSLEGLTAQVPPPVEVTSADVLERFERLRRQHAVRHERQLGDKLVEGDEVTLDIAGYTASGLLPTSVRYNWVTDLMPDPLLPGLFEALVGKAVGETADIPCHLPADYPAEALRGTTVNYIVRVRAASALVLPEPDAPELLQALGRGATLDEVMQRLVQELSTERETEAALEARESVLDELAARTQVDLPQSVVDEELRRGWSQTEGQALKLMDFPPEALDESLRNWLGDTTLRLEAIRRLRIALALRAFAERGDFKVDSEHFKSAVALVTDFGLSREQLREALQEDPTLVRKFEGLAIQMTGVDYVMSRAQFTA